jgi:hypothetical protein
VAVKGLGLDDALLGYGKATGLVDAFKNRDSGRLADSKGWAAAGSGFLSDIRSAFTDSDYRAAAFSNNDVASTFEAWGGQPTSSYVDANALSTFADLHDRQRNYLAIEWRQVAANVTTRVFSPFAIDRSADVETIQQSNRMISGQVSGFDMNSVVKFAEASVGGVGGDPSKTPGWFG